MYSDYWTYYTEKRTTKQIIESAERAIDDGLTLTTDEQKEWFHELLDILYNGGYATIHFDNRNVDVQSITNTHTFASFFDIINHSKLVDFSVKPQKTDSLFFPYIDKSKYSYD